MANGPLHSYVPGKTCLAKRCMKELEEKKGGRLRWGAGSCRQRQQHGEVRGAEDRIAGLGIRSRHPFFGAEGFCGMRETGQLGRGWLVRGFVKDLASLLPLQLPWSSPCSVVTGDPNTSLLGKIVGTTHLLTTRDQREMSAVEGHKEGQILRVVDKSIKSA